MSLPPSFFAFCSLALIATPIRAQEQVPLLPLSKGDTWEFAVTVSASSDAQLPTGEGVTVRKTTDGVEALFNKSRVYVGKNTPKEGGETYDTFVFTKLGKITEYEFLNYTNEAIFACGSKDETAADSKLYLSGTPLLIYNSKAKPGDQWKIKIGEGDQNSRIFKVFGEETVQVPAGEFKATRMVMTGTSGPLELTQTYWFAPGMGFVKEEKTTYSQSKRLFQQVMELTKFTKGTP